LSSLALPPGPRSPALVQTLSWARDAMRLLDRCRERYGPIFTVKLLVPETTVFVGTPAGVKSILSGRPSEYDSGVANVIMKPILGAESVVLLDGDPHLRERRRLLPPFHGDHVRRYRSSIDALARRELASWRVGETFALHPRMERLSFNVIMTAVFGAEEGARLESFRDYFLRMMRLTAARPAFSALMTATEDWGRYSPTFRRLSRGADAYVHGEIERRRSDPHLDERDDVLSMLIRGGELDDHQLRDHLMTLLIAGYETTATGLAWTFERLLRHPAALERLTEELETDDDAYLDAVIKETLRVRTLAPVVFRRLRLEREVEGHDLPEGTTIGISPHLIHRLPELYPEPDRFRPERFLEPHPPDTYTWIPFGGGVRRCVGASFSFCEMKAIVGAILRHARLRAPDPAPERPKRIGIIYRPALGARVTLDALDLSPGGAPAAQAVG
jgi:cytochrome P450